MVCFGFSVWYVLWGGHMSYDGIVMDVFSIVYFVMFCFWYVF